MATPNEEYGWTAVPRSLSKLLSSRPNPRPPKVLHLSDLPLPSDPLSTQVTDYARATLPLETFNHSMRVYYYALAILTTHLPHLPLTPQTLLLTTLLHDLGTTPKTQFSTPISFEFSGALEAYNLLLSPSYSAPKQQAEAVFETIIRHQDLGETGNVTVLTAAVHFGTLVDNAGTWVELVGEAFVREVVERWPRMGWTGCFAGVVRGECERKPWSNTTRIEGFAEMVEGNEVMAKYD